MHASPDHGVVDCHISVLGKTATLYKHQTQTAELTLDIDLNRNCYLASLVSQAESTSGKEA